MYIFDVNIQRLESDEYETRIWEVLKDKAVVKYPSHLIQNGNVKNIVLACMTCMEAIAITRDTIQRSFFGKP